MMQNIRGKDAGLLAWNPKRRILAIAWQCGAISLWDGEMDAIRATSLQERTNKHVDRFPISVLTWHEEGKNFFTGDRQGVAILWAMDEQKKPTTLWEYREQSAHVITACFGPVPLGPDGAPAAHATPACFFVLHFPALKKWKILHQTGMPQEPPTVAQTLDK